MRKALSANKRTAQTMLDDMVASVRAHKNGVIPRNISWATFEERYLQYCETDKKKNTTYRDKQAFAMMQETFQIVRLSQVSPELLEKLKFRWKEKEKKPSVITRSIKSLKTAMRKAQEWGYIQEQDWRTVKLKEPKGRLIYYSVEELEGLIKSCPGIYRLATIIMSRSGLRSGEIYHLRFEDIHFDLHKIHIINKPCDRNCPGCESGQWFPKGNKERWVPMSHDLEAYLKALPRIPGFVLGEDRPLLQPFLTHFARLIKKQGLKGSPHTLRHTFASHAVSGGASRESIQEILGHEDVRTTAKYTHLMPHVAQEAITKLPVVRLGYTLTTKSGLEQHKSS